MSNTQRPEEPPTVLVIADDRDLADTYSIWLESEYVVRTAYSGAEGLTWYDPSIDIVVFDRRIPDLAGTTLLESMDERDVDDQKAMLTKIEPGSEIVGVPCDEYLTKPITKSQLRDSVRELQIRSELDAELQRHFTLTSKIAALENSSATGTAEAVAKLRREAERFRARIEDKFSEVDGHEQPFRLLD